MQGIEIRPISASPDVVAQLANLIVAVVGEGSSVSFMAPLAAADARAFWEKSLAAADRGERVVLGAFAGAEIVGTVTLLLDLPPNQPHRAEIAKLIVRTSHRGLGFANALMRAAEAAAVERDRGLIVLDTAVDGGAADLYEKLGYQLAGVIPDYAYKPHGGLTGTRLYWKRIGRLAAGGGEASEDRTTVRPVNAGEPGGANN